MKKNLMLSVLAFVCALIISAGVHAQESDAFKKYGRNLKEKSPNPTQNPRSGGQLRLNRRQERPMQLSFFWMIPASPI